MKKLAYVIAALCAIAVAAPSVANAGDHHGWHHDRGWHHGWNHHDRGWHNGWHHHHDRVVIRHRY